MKKFFVLMVVMAVTAVMPASAQGVKIGVKGGLNNTQMKFDKSVFDAENRFGWFAGPVVKIELPITGLGVDIAGLYDQRETKVNDEKIQQKSILVPINARLNLGLGDAAGIYVAAGPQFGFNVGDDEFKWKDKDNYERTFQLKKSSFSVNLGAGLYLSDHFEVGFTYNIAMGKTADATFKDAIKTATTNDDTKAKAWTISACYYF